MKIKSFFVAAVCAVVQYYDYHLFGLLAAKISKTFFHSGDSTSQLLKTYLLMFVAVLGKPIGALILGRIGDLYGRFATIIMSLTGTAIASLIIGLTPGFEKIGTLAALILLIARMGVSGFVSSGTDGVRIYIFEHIGKTKQALGNGLITFFTQIGSLLASLSAWFFTLNFMPDYAWRFAFLLGTAMGTAVILFRLFVISDTETLTTTNESDYYNYKEKKTFNIIAQHWKLFLVCTIIAGCIGSTYQFIIIFFGTYNSEILKLLSPSQMKFYTSIGISFYMLASVLGGMFADYFGKRRVANAAGIIVTILSFIFSGLIAYKNFSAQIYFMITATLPFITMPALAFLKQSIPSAIRYRVFSLAHAVGSIIISAPTPFFSTMFFKVSGQAWLPMIYFITTVLLMMIVINILHYINLLQKNTP